MKKKSNGVYGFYICDKPIRNIFGELGFTRNKTLSVSAPKQLVKSKDPKIYAAFIRGFADCDGCITFMRRKGKYSTFKKIYNTYPRIIIKVISKKIIRDISLMLRKLHIHHTTYKSESYRINEKDTYQILVRGDKGVEKWMKKIGFNNPSKAERYNIWRKFGICPPKMTLEQRNLIKNGKISPFDLYKEGFNIKK